MMRFLPVFPLALLHLGCTDVSKPSTENEDEVITTVALVFGNGVTESTFVWTDPENDGDPLIEPIILEAGTTYGVAVTFHNDPADEDITPEIADEADQHQIFYTGSAVPDLLDLTYDDFDANGDPLGLAMGVDTNAAGSAELVLTLRHMPPQDGTAQKVPGLDERAASDGIDALPGDTDVQVRFPVTLE